MKIGNFAVPHDLREKVKMAKPSQPQQPGVSAQRATPPEFPDVMDDPYGIAATKESVIVRSQSAAIPAGSDACFAFPGGALVPR